MSMGKYSPKEIREVLSTYMKEIRKHIDARDEFKENYFGSFRYSKTGIRSMKKQMKKGLKDRSYLSSMHHELARLKKETEQTNEKRWEVENELNGHIFKLSKDDKEYAQKKVSNQLQKMNFFRKKIHQKRNKRSK